LPACQEPLFSIGLIHKSVLIALFSVLLYIEVFREHTKDVSYLYKKQNINYRTPTSLQTIGWANSRNRNKKEKKTATSAISYSTPPNLNPSLSWCCLPPTPNIATSQTLNSFLMRSANCNPEHCSLVLPKTLALLCFQRIQAVRMINVSNFLLSLFST
jgi:hypothetical protein